MNKLIAAVLLTLVMCWPEAHAQNITNPVITRIQTDGVRAEFPPFNSSRTTQTVNVTAYGLYAHSVTYSTVAYTTGVTVTVSASTDGSSYATQATSTAGAGTIEFEGTFSFVRIAFSGLTVSMPPFTAVYTGNSTPPNNDADIIVELEEVVTELETANTTLDSIDTNTASTANIGVLPRGTDTGGQTVFGITTTASVNTSGINNAATGLYMLVATNPTETEAYIFFHNDYTPTCNSATDLAFTSTPMAIPPSPAAGQVGGIALPITIPITGNFTTGLGVCIKGDATPTSNTVAPAGVLVWIGYYDSP